MAKVRDFMTAEIVTVSVHSDLADAARLMRDSDVGVLPVMDGDKVRGVITDRDIVIRGLADQKATASVGEIMKDGLISLSPDDDEHHAVSLMSEHNVRRLPVMENGRLVGMVSVGDIAVRASEKSAGKVMEKTGPQE
ncbi:MAG: CBS domain-containing protein [Tepidiformaceae bacterium]